MTTILNVFGPSNGNCTVSTNSVCQYPSFLSCSPNNLENDLYKNQFYLDSVNDEPSFKPPPNDVSSLGSLDLPSVSSEKSSSRDFSDGHCSFNNLASSELTDTERSNSTNSLSSNSQVNSIMSDEMPLRRLESAAECPTITPNSLKHCVLNDESCRIPVSSANCFPVSVSPVMNSNHRRIHPQSYPPSASVTFSSFNTVGNYHTSFYDSHYKYVPYHSWQSTYQHRRSPSSSAHSSVSYKHLLNNSSSDSSDISAYVPQCASSPYSLINGVKNDFDVNKGSAHLMNYPSAYGPYSFPHEYTNFAVQKKTTSYTNHFSNPYFYPQSVPDSAYNYRRGVNKSSYSVTHQSSVYHTPNFHQNANQLFLTNSASANQQSYTTKQTHTSGVCSGMFLERNINPHDGIGDSRVEHKHTTGRPAIYCSDYLSPENINLYDQCNITSPMSFNKVDTSMTTQLSSSLQQCTNEGDAIPVSKMFSHPRKMCEEVKKSKYKRKGEKSSDRGGKRRRSSNVSVAAISNSPPTEVIIRSILLQDVGKYLQNPVINLPFQLYPPPPSRSSLCDQDKPILDFDQVTNCYAHKYHHFPLCLSKPQAKPSDEYILHFLSSAPNIDSRVQKLLSDNFLVDTYKRAVVRNSSSNYFSPCSPITVCSPLVSIDDEHSALVTDSSRVSPILNLKCDNYFNETLNHASESYPSELVHREEVISFDQLTVHYRIICSNCAMQIISPNKSLVSKFQEKDRCVPFCSETCLLEYQKQLGTSTGSNSLCASEETNCYSTITTTVTDGLKELTVFILKGGVARFSKPNAKRPEVKATRRKQTDISLLSRTSIKKGCMAKRWRNIRWQRWNDRFCSHKSLIRRKVFSNVYNSDAERRRSDLMFSLEPDERICSLCHEVGDGMNDVANRLLNFDVGLWLHLNCILWCYDTYETIGGALVDVFRSYNKASRTLCAHCRKVGAGLPCFDSDCEAIYHLPCANKIGCSFYSDRSMYCPLHLKNEALSKLKTLIVDRRVYITRDEDAQVAEVISNEDVQTKSHLSKLRIGTLILHRIGQLLPDHLESGHFHTSNFIYPVGFWSTRIYWSYRHVGRRCQYDCKIEVSPSPPDSNDESQSKYSTAKFVVDVIESNEENDHFEDLTCNGVWQKILTKINDAKKTFGSPSLKIFQDHLHGEMLFGLTEPQIIRAIESLPGVDYLHNYVFKFGKSQLIKEMPLALNPTGCARSEPKSRTYVRRKPSGDAHNSSHNLLNYKILGSPYSSGSEMGSPSYLNSQSPNLISKFQQYRRLRSEWKMNIFLARSRIQGLGLYAARDITKHTFIIEYLGEMIRNEVGNLRERLYESQNRGVYMFRVNEDWIVDATMCGGLARYINHSCDPNCSAEILNCDNGSHIVIIANKNIEKGDEITYDYKFDLEEDRWDRIPCLCGSSNCRKWMN